MQKGIFTFLFFLSLAKLTTAQTTMKYSLETLVEAALSRSDQITSQKARIDEKEESAALARAWQNPLLELSAGAKFVTPDVGPHFQVGLSQPFFFPGKQGLRKEVLDFEKTLEEIRLSETELAITVDVVRLAYEYAIYEHKARFAENRRKRFELIRAYLAGHTFASPQQQITSNIVKQRLKNISADEQHLQGALQATLQQLNFYVAQDMANRPEIQVPWLEGKRVVDESLWVERALSSNTELASQRVLVNQATKEKDLSSKELWPDFSLSAFYAQESAGQTERFLGLGISFPLPIWNQNRPLFRSKEHKIRAETYQLSLKERKVKSLVQKLVAEYASDQTIVAEYSKESLATLESQLQSMEKEFRKNRIDFILFLELDIQATETANRVLNAQLHLLDTVASLHFLARDKNLLADLSTF